MGIHPASQGVGTGRHSNGCPSLGSRRRSTSGGARRSITAGSQPVAAADDAHRTARHRSRAVGRCAFGEPTAGMPMMRAIAAGSALLVSLGSTTALASESGVRGGQPAADDPAVVETLLTSGGPIAVRRLATGLEHPWGLAFLPDGRMLVTERPGRLRILDSDHELSKPIRGTPKVFAEEQGGLLDVAIDPDFHENRLIYLSYAKPGPDGKATTALGRGRLTEKDRLRDFEDIFVQEPWIEGSKHFGNRIVFAPDGNLFFALGERFQFDPAQDLTTHLGKIIRIAPDGSTPSDNPFVDRPDARDTIWSYGHRNIEAAAIDPATNKLWIVEMGPLGGDELNQPEAGKNYGWPVVSWGMHYDGTDIADPSTRPDLADAVKHWSPVISPSGMDFYRGETFGAWKGDAFVGGLSSRDLVRLRIADDKLVEEERIPLPERIREVGVGPDGLIYLLVDKKEGDVWRVEPLR